MQFMNWNDLQNQIIILEPINDKKKTKCKNIIFFLIKIYGVLNAEGLKLSKVFNECACILFL